MSTKALQRLIVGLTTYERQQIELRFSSDPEVLALIQQPVLDYPLPTRCGQCGELQQTGARGVSCRNGHAGASPIPLTPSGWRTFDTPYKITAARVVVHPQYPQAPEYLVLDIASNAFEADHRLLGWRLLYGDRQIGFQAQSENNSPHMPPTGWADEQFSRLRYEGEGAQAVLILANGRRLSVV